MSGNMPRGDVIAAAAGPITWHVRPIAGLAVSVNKNVQLAFVIGCGGGNAVKFDIESTSHKRESAAEAQKNKRNFAKSKPGTILQDWVRIFARCTCHPWQQTGGILKTFPLQEKPAGPVQTGILANGVYLELIVSPTCRKGIITHTSPTSGAYAFFFRIVGWVRLDGLSGKSCQLSRRSRRTLRLLRAHGVRRTFLKCRCQTRVSASAHAMQHAASHKSIVCEI